MKRFLLVLVAVSLLVMSASAEELIRWVDFDVSCEAMQRALEIDIRTQGEEKVLRWTDILALAATECGGRRVGKAEVERAAERLRGDAAPEEFLGKQYQYFRYYQRAYEAALGGLVGNFAIGVTGEDGELDWKPQYGLKAFSPIAEGYGYQHYDDFGNSRSYGFARKHLGNDLMGSLGTPIVAVESGEIEALGWNQYGGWRIGIRSQDKMRYYYYAHLQKDHPFAEGLAVGDFVQAGDVIGFMGRTGYSRTENVNNIDEVHLHFGLELIFDESQKECDNEIWIDVYDIVSLLNRHRSSVRKNPTSGTWERVYPFRDLDAKEGL